MTAEIRRAVLDLLRGTDIYSTEGTWSESAERAIIDGAVMDGAVMDTAVIDGAAADSGRPAAAGERPAAGAGAGRDVRGQLHRAGALARAIQMAAAIERMLELTVAYCGERRQFGRSLAQFQAVQQQLALLAGEALAARGAAQRALTLLGPGEWAAEPVAVAKVRTGMAATVAARIAHQLHGAMGITTEHALHRFTVPAWSWREEYGNERHWSAALAAECGSELWEAVTAVS